MEMGKTGLYSWHLQPTIVTKNNRQKQTARLDVSCSRGGYVQAPKGTERGTVRENKNIGFYLRWDKATILFTLLFLPRPCEAKPISAGTALFVGNRAGDLRSDFSSLHPGPKIVTRSLLPLLPEGSCRGVPAGTPFFRMRLGCRGNLSPARANAGGGVMIHVNAWQAISPARSSRNPGPEPRGLVNALICLTMHSCFELMGKLIRCNEK